MRLPQAAMLATALVGALAPVAAYPDGHGARAFLSETFGLTSGDFGRIDAGEVVARATAAGDPRDIATLGIVRVKITPAFYVERLADITTFKKYDGVLQIGVFGQPPALRDIENLTLDEPDFKSLRDCRVGDCGLQLPAESIVRFRNEVDWNRPDARQRANGLMRQMIVDYVMRYQQAGTEAAMHYADRRDILNVGREFLSLAASDAGGWGRFPSLRQHLFDYPAVSAPDAKDLLYWSKEVVGRRNVASVTHLAILPGVAGSPAAFVVGSKQIYGTHYFDASLGLTVLVADRSSSPAATYVVYLNRSRVDVLGGVFGGVARRIIVSKARGTVGDNLGRLRTRLEQEFGRR